MLYIKTEDNVNLFVEDINPSGSKTVVFIHGWPLDHRMFEYQTNILPAYGFRCVTFDIRGFGHSDCPWDDYGYTRLAEDVRNLTDQLKIDKFILAGFSMGGAVAIRYMSRYAGDRVTKLALLSAAAPSFVKRPGYDLGMDTNQANTLLSLAYRDRSAMTEAFTGVLFAGPVTAAVKNRFNTIALDASGHGTIKAFESMRDEDLRHELFSISVPAGIFHGERDLFCPFSFAQVMHRQIGNSVLYSFQNSAHAVFYDELDRFNDTFLHFLQT